MLVLRLPALLAAGMWYRYKRIDGPVYRIDRGKPDIAFRWRRWHDIRVGRPKVHPRRLLNDPRPISEALQIKTRLDEDGNRRGPISHLILTEDLVQV